MVHVVGNRGGVHGCRTLSGAPGNGFFGMGPLSLSCRYTVFYHMGAFSQSYFRKNKDKKTKTRIDKKHFDHLNKKRQFKGKMITNESYVV